MSSVKQEIIDDMRKRNMMDPDQYENYKERKAKEASMQDWQIRLVKEHEELSERILKLESFIHSDVSNEISEEEYSDLCAQLRVMKDYQDILYRRITRSMSSAQITEAITNKEPREVDNVMRAEIAARIMKKLTDKYDTSGAVRAHSDYMAECAVICADALLRALGVE